MPILQEMSSDEVANLRFFNRVKDSVGKLGKVGQGTTGGILAGVAIAGVSKYLDMHYNAGGIVEAGIKLAPSIAMGAMSFKQYEPVTRFAEMATKGKMTDTQRKATKVGNIVAGLTLGAAYGAGAELVGTQFKNPDVQTAANFMDDGIAIVTATANAVNKK